MARGIVPDSIRVPKGLGVVGAMSTNGDVPAVLLLHQRSQPGRRPPSDDGAVVVVVADPISEGTPH
jgi:hypothetical protein